MESTATTSRPLLLRLPIGATTILGLLVLMWSIELVDTTLLDNDLQANGIHPRRIDGLIGVIWAPLLHSTFGHLASNTIPFAVLGGLVAVRGFQRWLAVTLVAVVVGGGLTWLLAGGSNHIGASGVVFAYFGALVSAAVVERRPASIAPALVALLLYGGLIVGLVPQTRVSWEGHLFGLVAGMLAARSLAHRPEPKPDVAQPWEADQPWLDP
jgi:membrane associated rhomboid family serine protease